MRTSAPPIPRYVEKPGLSIVVTTHTGMTMTIVHTLSTPNKSA